MKPGDAVEFELRFRAPKAAWPALERAFGTARSGRVALAATYFDTADGRLAAAGHVLRLRREGRQWVQALKSRGDGLASRPEHEVALGAGRRAPPVDPARHAGTAEGDAVLALLADGTPLQERLRTQVLRRTRLVRHAGATVELAYDRGRVVAGASSTPVAEVEFEWRSGPPHALLALAERWVLRHGLWLEVRTKSERGAPTPPRKAEPATWPGGASAGQAFAAMLREALRHLLPNAAVLAEGVGQPEHVHQARVALRRLRTVLRCFGRWSAEPALAARLEQAWRAPAQRLGATRDADVLAALGLPPLPAQPPAEDPGGVAREPAFTLLALQTFALALAPADAASAPASALAGGVLRAAWKAVEGGARRFADDGEAARHRTRRRLKRLRYAAEFLLPVLPAARSRRALAAVSSALDALGDHNDLVVAAGWVDRLDSGDPRVAAVRADLARRRRATARLAARRLARLARHAGFWQRR